MAQKHQPQAVGQLIATNRGRQNSVSASRATQVSQVNGGRLLTATLQRWKTRDDLLHTFCIDKQIELTKIPERCFFQNAPTLWTVNLAYGFGTAQEWLAYQITDLSEFSGAKDKITDRQLDEIIQLITDDYGFLNLAEIMLFCRRFKKGSYDKFYGSVDPISIMQGLNVFCRERNEAYAKRDRKLQEIKDWNDRWNPNNMTYEEAIIINQMQAEYAMNTKEQDMLTEQKYKQELAKKKKWQVTRT